MAEYRQSAQRRALLEYLKSVTTHPTAAVIYENVSRSIPRLSLGTVYRNLDILRRQGLVRQLDGDGRHARFDGTPEPHGHFYCRLCGAVEDLPWSRDWEASAMKALKAGQRPEEVRMEVKGVCARCGRKSKIKGETTP